jgi:hypothetical protein
MRPASKPEAIWSLAPIILGVCFIAVVELNQWLFKAGSISVGFAIGAELIVVLAGLLASLAQVFLAARYLLRRRWGMAGLSITAGCIWFACLGYGIGQGAAIVYAT